MPKLHAPRYGDRGVGRTLCGRAVALVVEDPSHVTCTTCQRLASRSAERRTPITWEEAIREVLHVIGGPRTEPYPHLSPDVWRTMRCRDGRECHCELCLIDAGNERAKATWEAEQQIRPHRQHEHPFGSTAAALELLLRWTQDGPSTRSSQGSLQARCEETARLGTQVQTTRRHDREDLTTRRADYAHDVERAVTRAYAEASERRGLTAAQCRAVLLSTVDAQRIVSAEEWAERLGCSEAIVKAVIRHGRRVVTVELAAVGHVPMPRDRSGLLPAIERRRAEVAA